MTQAHGIKSRINPHMNEYVLIVSGNPDGYAILLRMSRQEACHVLDHDQDEQKIALTVPPLLYVMYGEE